MSKYNPAEIEPKWQNVWEKTPELYAAVDGDKTRPKYYVLTEFPYPSGDGLHVGHARPYIAQDIIARRLRMMGKNVLYPMGWDAFGLPTENYAIKHKIRPQDATSQNVANFRRQMKLLGLSYDWSREINTSDPAYYKWTQWIFLQLFKHDLAYQDEIAINWCPKERVGLANEEVINGKHERCGTPVEKKILKQWMLRITKYADRLIGGLGDVDYLDQVAAQQVNWIGKSHGAEIEFELNFKKNPADNKRRGPDGKPAHFPVFTTRADTLFGATYLVLAPEHPWVTLAIDDDHDVLVNKEAVKSYVNDVASRSDLERISESKDKTGVLLEGVVAINPATKEEIPMWVADYVLPQYGTGAIMAVPAHDTRDHEFAIKFNLPITPVIEPVLTRDDAKNLKDFIKKRKIVAVVENSKGELLTINWGPKLGGRLFIGGTVEGDESPEITAVREVTEETGYTDLELLAIGDETFHYKYFAFSKQEAHETDVRFVYFKLKSDAQQDQNLDESEKGNFAVEWVSKDRAEREIVEPLHRYGFNKFIQHEAWTGQGILYNSAQFDGMTTEVASTKICSWLAEKCAARVTTQYKLRDWVFSRQHYWGEPIPIIHCPKDGVVPVPESDLPVVLPEVEHYEPTETGESPLANITDWVEVSCPVCGGPAKRETDTMPNWAGSSWYYLRYTDPHNDQAFASTANLDYWLPVDLYNGGMEHTTLHLLYSRFWHQFMYDQGLVPTPEPYAVRRSHGMILAADKKKMSKSLGNVINPDDMVHKYGADATRLYEMFMGPYDQAIDWNEDKLAGVYRFLNRVWTITETLLSDHRTAANPSGEDATFETEVDRMVHKTLKRLDVQLDNRSFNTTVSALMELVNFLHAEPTYGKLAQSNFSELARRTAQALTLMLAPLTPHLSEELWQNLGEVESVHKASWPKYDPQLIKDDFVTIIVQVNGKLRGKFAVEAGLDAKALEQHARAENDQQKWTHEAEITKVIPVPNRLINFVVKA